MTWLEARPKQPVGWSQSFDDCPLARAIIDRGEFVPGAFHGTHAILYKPGSFKRFMKHEWEYPVWARQFVAALDAGPECVVVGDEALDCLNGAGWADVPSGRAVQDGASPAPNHQDARGVNV